MKKLTNIFFKIPPPTSTQKKKKVVWFGLVSFNLILPSYNLIHIVGKKKKKVLLLSSNN